MTHANVQGETPKDRRWRPPIGLRSTREPIEGCQNSSEPLSRAGVVVVVLCPGHGLTSEQLTGGRY